MKPRVIKGNPYSFKGFFGIVGDFTILRIVQDKFTFKWKRNNKTFICVIIEFRNKDAFEGIVVDRMTQNKEVCEKILDDEKFSRTVIEALVGYVYEKLRAV